MTRRDRPAWELALGLVRCVASVLAPMCTVLAQGGGESAADRRSESPLAESNARNATGEGFAFVEITADQKSYFVLEPFRVKVRFGVEKSFLGTHVIQLFRQELDVPVQLDAPWLEELAGAKLLATPTATAGAAFERKSFALGDRVGEATPLADRVELGRTFAVFEIERSYFASRPGDLLIPSARLALAVASRFEDDLIRGRVAVDRSDVFVESTPLSLAIAPLPEEGRPAEFSGAVGQFSVRADAAPRDVAVGESVKVVLSIEGTVDADAFQPPRFAGADGWRVYGMVEAGDALLHTVTYDVAPTSEKVREVPSFALTIFDTHAPAAYRTLRTPPIPITVRARGASDEESGAAADLDPEHSSRGPAAASTRSPPRKTKRWFVIGIAIGVAVVTALAASRRSSVARSDGTSARHVAQAGSAAYAFRARIQAHDADLAGALTEYLAARLARSTADVVGSNVRAPLVAAGVPADLAARTAAMFEHLVAARYGGAAAVESKASVAAIVDELEAAWPGTP